MKKVFIAFTIVTVSALFCSVHYSMAQQDTSPPLLMQQAPAPPPVPGGSPGLPASGTSPGSPPPPPPPGPGIGIVQTISTQTLLNNLATAVTTAERVGNLLTPGKVWKMQGTAGEIEIKAGVLYQGSVVAVLHFNSVDGSVLPLGMHPRTYQKSIQVQAVKARLTAIVSELKILPAAEFMEPEASWSFPVVLGNTIVARLKVYYDGIHIVPDYPANQEMMFYGQ